MPGQVPLVFYQERVPSPVFCFCSAAPGSRSCRGSLCRQVKPILEVTMSSVLIAVVILMLVVLAEAVHHRFQRERRRKHIAVCMLACLK
jgi:hypothetical protein